MKNTKEKQQLFHMYIQLSCRSHALCNLHIYHNRSVRRNTSTTSQCPPQPIPVHEKKRKKQDSMIYQHLLHMGFDNFSISGCRW